MLAHQNNQKEQNMRTKTKGIARRVTLVVAAFVVLVLGISVAGQASASQSTYPWDSADIKNQSLGSVDFAPNSVGSSEITYQGVIGFDIKNGDVTGVDIQDGSITTKDLSDATEAKLKGNTGDTGAAGKDGVVDPIDLVTEKKTVTNMGGTWGTLAEPRATLLGSVDVPAGKYMVTANGFFTADADGNPVEAQVQTAVRYDNGTKWGVDLGTAYSTTGTWKGRDYTTSSTRVVTIPTDTTVSVYGFGYDIAGESSQNSGQFDASAYLTLTPVQD
jgi:hypothetical protein